MRFGLIIFLLFSITACGDLLKSKVIKKGLESTQFRANCDLDVNEFFEIMDRNISSQIRCLHENLNIFMTVVETDRPGSLSRIALEQYVKKNRPDIKPEIQRALKTVFDVNFLITGEHPDYISKENVDKLIDFALLFNEEAAQNFGRIFKNESPASYDLHLLQRDRVSSSSKKIVMALRKIFKPNRGGEVHKLSITEMLDNLTTEDTRDISEKVKKLLFIKSSAFGGSKDILTHTELERILLNFDQLLLITLDGVRFKHIILKQDSLLQLLKRDVDDLYDIIHQGQPSSRDMEVLFTVDEALEAAKMFVKKEDFDIEKFRNLILEGKKILMGGNTTEVRGFELKNLFNHGKSILQTGTVFHKIYAKFKTAMDSKLPVTINFDEYRHTYPEHQAELNQFERIVKRYRFFKGEFTSPYYSEDYRRNANAVFEIAIFEYGIKLIFQTYGLPSPNKTAIGGVSMNQELMQKLFKKFEKELIALELLIPRRALTSADNVSLLGTLFQYQSDNNEVLDVNEAAEFGISLVTTLNMSKKFMTYLKDKGCSVDQYNRLEPQCFRENFLKAWCVNYRAYYPLFFKSLGFPEKCEDFSHTNYSAAFLERSIEAARDCNNYTDGKKEEIPYSENDILSILMALIHAETTILRWDVNKNNFLDPSEVNAAYDIYESALNGFLTTRPPIVRRFKKQIYQYLVKYEEVPDEKEFSSIWRFIKFLLKFNKNSNADRKTIISILGVIALENKKVSKAPPFECNWLRDPTHIPREDERTLIPANFLDEQKPDYSSMLNDYLYLTN